MWLCLYAAAVLVIMLVMMGFTDAFASFLVFFAWFILPPTVSGTAVSALLYRRGRSKVPPKETEPEWKKYVERR